MTGVPDAGERRIHPVGLKARTRSDRPIEFDEEPVVATSRLTGDATLGRASEAAHRADRLLALVIDEEGCAVDDLRRDRRHGVEVLTDVTELLVLGVPDGTLDLL